MNTAKQETKTLKSASTYGLPQERLIEFCEKWQITELALFGSILRADFSPHSDVDLLITFAPQTRASLLDLVQIQTELEHILGRKVDVLTRKSVEQSHNWLRKQHILQNAQVIYVA